MTLNTDGDGGEPWADFDQWLDGLPDPDQWLEDLPDPDARLERLLAQGPEDANRMTKTEPDP
jgi:hypothetical protein